MSAVLDALLEEVVLDGLAREVISEQTGEANKHGWQASNPYLASCLQRCVDARDLIESEQAKLRPLIEASTNEIERAAREYQHDLIAWQLTRAAEVAEKRIAHLDSLTDIETENAKCEADTLHWFEYYAWTIDPRPDVPLAVMPLSAFPFQERYLKWLDYITFEKRSSGVVEKCRTMGATEVALRWILKHWRYRQDFYAMPLSANEDLVDSKKDPGTLFEKLRFQLRLLPTWMLPKGFSLKDMPFMQLVNPENNSVIQGDAPTVNVGRQRRATFVLKDESAAWANGGYQQHTALSRTANTICDVSSVQGKQNKFADLAHDNRTPKFEMDWRDHPWYDTRWYGSLPYGYIGPAMTPEEIAQEIDRNYEASQPGKVIKNCREEYCFITWSEMIRGFSDLGFAVYREQVPLTWKWGRISDYGISARTENDTHIWAYNLFTRPAEGWPLADSLFFFCALPIEPIGASELQAFQFYSSIERQFAVRSDKGLRRPDVNDMSHEAADAKEVLLTKCADNWNIPDLDFFEGVSKLRYHFELTETEKPNPFRPELKGRSRIYFVAPDGEYELGFNERRGSYFVTASNTQRGYKRLRAEIQSWHFLPEERGKPIQKMRPKPVFDDIVTTVRYALARWGVKAAPKSQDEKREEKLRPEVQLPAIIAESDPLIQQAKIQSRDLYLKRMVADEQREQNKRFTTAKIRFRR